MRILLLTCVFSLFSSLALAQQPPWFNSFSYKMDPAPGFVASTFIWHGKENYSNQAGELGTTYQATIANIPISHDENHITSVFLNESARYFKNDRTLEQGTTLSNAYHDMGMGFQHRRRLGKNKKDRFGVFVQGGMFSDEPFEDIADVSYQANITYRLGTGTKGKNGWVFLANISNIRGFANNLPLPGLMYAYESNPKWTVFVGVPIISVQYRPTKKWSLQTFTLAGINSEASVSFAPIFPTLFTAGYRWGNQTWQARDRVNNDDRVNFSQMQAFLNLRQFLSYHWGIFLEGSYAFERRIFESENFFNPGVDITQVDPTFTFQGGISFLWGVEKLEKERKERIKRLKAAAEAKQL